MKGDSARRSARERSGEAMKRSAATLLALVSTLSGCVRGGFGFSTGVAGLSETSVKSAAPQGTEGPSLLDARRPEGGVVRPDRPLVFTASVTSANDTCANPAVIDLSPLATKGVVTFTVETAGAAHDYNVTGCEGLADVLVQLVNGPSSFTWACNGGGTLRGAWPSSDLPCAQSFTGGMGLTCSGLQVGLVITHAGAAYMLFCRDPASGPATVTLQSS